MLEELLTKTKTLKKKSHVVSDHVFALATKGHQRKSSHSKSLSFGQFSMSEEDTHPQYDFGQNEEYFKEIRNWVVEFKKFPLALDPKYLAMMSLRHQEEGNSSVTGPLPPQPKFDVHMLDVNPSTAPSHRFQFGINSMNNLLSQRPQEPVLNI